MADSHFFVNSLASSEKVFGEGEARRLVKRNPPRSSPALLPSLEDDVGSLVVSGGQPNLIVWPRLIPVASL